MAATMGHCRAEGRVWSNSCAISAPGLCQEFTRVHCPPTACSLPELNLLESASKCRTSVGPPRAADLGLHAHIDTTEARHVMPRVQAHLAWVQVSFALRAMLPGGAAD